MSIEAQASVDPDGSYTLGLCPADGCPAADIPAPVWAVVCERCHAQGCDECIVNEGDGYICDDCRAVGQ